MEQRNFSEHKDILPIEDLLAGNRPMPGLYKNTYRYRQEPPEPPRSKTAELSDVVPASSGLMKPSLMDDYPLEKPKKKIKPEKTRPSRIRKIAPLFWGLIGFAIGVAFWNFVGFWNFVEVAVLTNPQQPTQLSSSIVDQQNRADLAAGRIVDPKIGVIAAENTAAVADEDLRTCITLVMDRSRDKTYARRCEPGHVFRQGQSLLRTTAQVNR